MGMVEPLPRRLEATDKDLGRGRDAASAIVASILGRDPGTMVTASSMSHYVYIGADIVVKLVDADGHTRLDREIALAPHLPPGLGAPLLASGRYQHERCDVRYACFARMPGGSPGPGLPDRDAATAQQLAEQAVRLLDDLHEWTPAGDAALALRQSPRHEGFASRAALVTDIEHVATADRGGVVPRRLLNGLLTIAQHAPERARADVPVHADCDWGNWLTQDHTITALLDFERARFGEPADDWVLLAVTSGPHLGIVLDTITEITAIPLEVLRAECEVRHAAFITEELRFWLEHPDPSRSVEQWILKLDGLVTGRQWWRQDR